ncbi:FHA domain-containing protein [Nocardia sp. NPDC020380]|uniref:FHA domain-containing protein n=1 Tax=Nocardia sp. NPDC020380 TaxID=3364309 RepID=UPI00379B5CDD
MAICPSGHDSEATDYCDICGLQIRSGESATPATESADEPCPVCGEPRTGRFCEGCSYDFVAGVPHAAAAGTATGTLTASTPAPAMAETMAMATPTLPNTTPPPVQVAVESAWTATVSADRTYYETMRSEDDEIEFPAYCPDRTFPLQGAQVRVGRYSASKGIDPEIDLAGPPQDPGISHLHFLIVAQPGNGWAVIDLGSTNGTRINGAEDPIPHGTTVPLRSGDRIHLGAWTTLTVLSAET